MKTAYLLAAAVAATAVPATAAVTVDGVRDASYRQTASVIYDPAAPSGNFGAPTNMNNGSAYTISLFADSSAIYGFFQADRNVQGSLPFANLYFDIDPDRAVPNGSDLIFEVTNRRAAVPGMSGYADVSSGLQYAWSVDGTALEFSIANSLFTGRIPGLTYYGDEIFPTNGSPVTLRLSQSFGYSAAGGFAFYGNDRLGTVTLGGNAGAVPEPATWAMLIMGFGLVGAALRRRNGVRSLGVRFA